MSILKFDSYEEVLERANRTCYGLGAGIITKDSKCQDIRVTTVNFNWFSPISILHFSSLQLVLFWKPNPQKECANLAVSFDIGQSSIK